MKKTFVYIDGYNLYYGMMDLDYIIPNDNSKPALRKYLWLNLLSYTSSFLAKYYSVEKIHYFTAPVLGNPDSLIRQKQYWKALESIPNLEIHYGKHIITGGKYSEKQTDVRFALQMHHDAIYNQADCMVLLCADSDQIPTIERIRQFKPSLEFRAIFPPCRHSDDLRTIIPVCHKSDYKRLKAHQFPEVINYQRDGQTISVSRPVEWT